MVYATAARRIPTLALVVGAHALALAFLLELTRTHLFRAGAEESLTLVDLQPTAEPRPPEPSVTTPRANERPRSAVAPPVGAPAPPSHAAPPRPGPAPIDWAAEGADAADRVEALPGGVTVFNINDNCAIALLWVVPAFACKLGKIPPRGDLFGHMRDLEDQDRH